MDFSFRREEWTGLLTRLEALKVRAITSGASLVVFYLDLVLLRVMPAPAQHYDNPALWAALLIALVLAFVVFALSLGTAIGVWFLPRKTLTKLLNDL